MTNEEISTVVQELPLFVLLKLKRSTREAGELAPVSPTSVNNDKNNDSSSSGHTSPNITNIKVNSIILFSLVYLYLPNNRLNINTADNFISIISFSF